MALARNVGAEGGGPHFVERSDHRTPCGFDNQSFARGDHALSVGLPERNEPHGSGNEICGDCLQVRGKRGLDRDVVSGSRGRNRDRIRKRTGS